MEWMYKNVVIRIESDGKFYYVINGKTETANSLEFAYDRIDTLLSYYYNFSKNDIKKMCNKLDKREVDFLTSLINEIKIHEMNAYCEIGLSEDFLFKLTD